MILLLGASGYVGSAFAEYLEATGQPYQAVSRADCNYYQAGELAKLIDRLQPEFLINCAGFTGKPNVDACELAKAETLLGNAVLPGLIARECKTAGLPWGHVSSGCIYTGRNAQGDGFKETDVPNFTFRDGPCSFYSGTKALGEEALGCVETVDADGQPVWAFESDDPIYIWRLRIPFSRVDSPRNYLSKLQRYARLLEAENSISRLEDFVAACFGCWEKRVPYGVYNVTNPGAVTTREVVAMLCEAAQAFPETGLPDREFQFFGDESEFMQQAAKTPRSNCVMDASKLASVGIEMPPVHDAVRDCLQGWQSESLV
ncbi:sugar nucleotide-binding protein [Cerasicoccus frondis]|uniref:sugar nucleotide-binding protein n=1 Tax=Cerasicoccus frondis TaxID=490090 RepID=UPI002852C7D5|nr:sugar nucleotide-binding protein [Cerasicoccus frondis]